MDEIEEALKIRLTGYNYAQILVKLGYEKTEDNIRILRRSIDNYFMYKMKHVN